MTAKRKRGWRTVLPAVLVTLAVVAGVSLLLYPSVSEYISSLNFRRDIEGYRSGVSEIGDNGIDKMLGDAAAFNKELAASGSVGQLGAERLSEYKKLLNPRGTGMMGYIEVKKAGIYLPVYHGTSESVLQSGIGHVEGSSLPVGGAGTHTILSGHSGLPSSKLFSNIDSLRTGDIFALHILGKTLVYRVESTEVLTSEQAEKQKIYPNADICTLMTCTPYGVNTHRLLVHGVRTELSGGGDELLPDGADIPVSVSPALPIAVAVALVCVAVFVILIIRRRKRRKKSGARV